MSARQNAGGLAAVLQAMAGPLGDQDRARGCAGRSHVSCSALLSGSTARGGSDTSGKKRATLMR